MINRNVHSKLTAVGVRCTAFVVFFFAGVGLALAQFLESDSLAIFSFMIGIVSWLFFMCALLLQIARNFRSFLDRLGVFLKSLF